MLTHRIMPCLDIKDGQTVKGVNFVNIQYAGDPVELAQAYVQQGADELVFLDISATVEQRATLKELVRRIALHINIPFTVGGGIRVLEDISVLLNAGADKVCINTAAVKNPSLIDLLARNFGSQCLVLAIDTKHEDETDMVYIHGGRTKTATLTRLWAKEAVERGIGEIMLTSIDHDGTRKGFNVALTSELSGVLSVPVIASGGAGSLEHFKDVFTTGLAEAALAAGLFHHNEMRIDDLKKYLNDYNIPVRL